jgi:NhaA family Na+:H+ antiporter
MNLKKIVNALIHNEKTSGVILVCVTIMSLCIANSGWQTTYTNFWHFEIGHHTIAHWVNDGLMAIFFLLIGLELEREIYQGELSVIKKASLPLFGALGGMFVPAGIFLLLNYGSATQSGAGIPMATDIAFAIGILSLLGNRVPTSLKIFLTALAVIDDLGAIVVIAIFYTSTFSALNFFIALLIFGFLIILNRLKVYNLIPYIIGGVAMWYFMLNSGVHATITGVLLAFAVPFGDGGKTSPSLKLQHKIHYPVIFFILPLFALANTCISLGSNWTSGLTEMSSLGVIFGLVIGKPLGIFLFAFIGVSLGLCVLPTDLKWKNILGVGFLGGIGFTMSIFITLLAFQDEILINNSKIAILVGSLIAGIIGLVFLKLTLNLPNNTQVHKTI